MSVTMVRTPADEAILRSAPDTPGCASHARRWVLLATSLGSSVAFLEASVINVALPAIQDGLHATLAEMQWIASAYTLVLAALGLLGAVAANRYGTRRLFLAGTVGIGAASLAAAFATSPWHLIASRGLQGLAAALLVPSSLLLLSASFPRKERGAAIGTWSASTAVAGAAAPLLGGLLVDLASWRAVFVLVIPLALAAYAVGWSRVPAPPVRHRAEPIDWLGAALVTSMLASLIYAMISLGSSGFGAPQVIFAFAVCALAAIGFALRERLGAAPMIPLAAFRSRAFLGINLVTLLLYFAVTGAFFLLPFNLVHVQGYSASTTGLAFLPFAATIAILSRRLGALASRLGTRTLLIAGAAVTSAGLALFALPGGGGSYWTTFFPPVALTGLGMALTVAPLTTAVMEVLGSSLAGAASGVNNAIARLATLLAVAIFGTLAVARFSAAIEQRVAPLALPAAVQAEVTKKERALADTRVAGALSADERARLEAILGEAYIDSFRWLVLVAAATALAGALAAAVLVDDGKAATLGEEDDLHACTHADLIRAVAPEARGCVECLRSGDAWVHLRMCLSCGHVGCCDSSKNRHATRHFWNSHHPIVQSIEPGEGWRWCYVDEVVV